VITPVAEIVGGLGTLREKVVQFKNFLFVQ